MYQRDPRHVDVLVKDLGLEQGNSIEKFNTADTGCKLQDVCSCQDRADTTCMSEDVKPRTTERCQVGEASQFFET